MRYALKLTLMSAALAVFALPVVAQDATPAPANQPRVNQRADNQQDRIANGIKDGQLKPGQAAHLEKNQARIDRQIRNDRAANGGKLTPQERQQINREQNRQSHQIYKDKHDGK